MRKFLLGLVCVLLVVGVASMGHAGLFGLFGGGGGGGKGHRGGSSGPPVAIFNHDFHQFVVQPPTQNPDPNKSVTKPTDWIEEFIKLPVPSYHFDPPTLPVAWNHDFNFDSNHRVSEGTGYIAQNGTPVPEPATVLLLGIGLLGLAGCGKRKFKG